MQTAKPADWTISSGKAYSTKRLTWLDHLECRILMRIGGRTNRDSVLHSYAESKLIWADYYSEKIEKNRRHVEKSGERLGETAKLAEKRGSCVQEAISAYKSLSIWHEEGAGLAKTPGEKSQSFLGASAAWGSIAITQVKFGLESKVALAWERIFRGRAFLSQGKKKEAAEELAAAANLLSQSKNRSEQAIGVAEEAAKLYHELANFEKSSKLCRWAGSIAEECATAAEKDKCFIIAHEHLFIAETLYKEALAFTHSTDSDFSEGCRADAARCVEKRNALKTKHENLLLETQRKNGELKQKRKVTLEDLNNAIDSIRSGLSFGIYPPPKGNEKYGPF